MRGPIDYIIVGFEGNHFDGSILRAIADAIDAGVIGLIALSFISKDAKGKITVGGVDDLGDTYFAQFAKEHPTSDNVVTLSDINEMADLINENCTAGLLVVEQLWAKPLKKALIDANGVLLAEGRIHPDAEAELDTITIK
jgi:hypothetical protein